MVSPLQRARETPPTSSGCPPRGSTRIGDGGPLGWSQAESWRTTVEIQRERPGWFLFRDGVAPGPPGHPAESAEQVDGRADRMPAKVDAAFAGTEGGPATEHGRPGDRRVECQSRVVAFPADGAMPERPGRSTP
ncbi:hypothetical protein AQI70_16590 [Streptomyces curacoi]|uniref:Uncharacterized protein n=1 Tax=Streptomyces curacoi TaxID=146536 RepID=A0A117P996_9ACTN|nr:hypothetical protein AQI70_16590 [Streptomyces curacoi]